MLIMESLYSCFCVLFFVVCASDIKRHILCVFFNPEILKRFKWVRCETSPTGLLSTDSGLSSFTGDTFTWRLGGNYSSCSVFITF